MQYTVVHSKDPYLLARLATDLQMSGYTHEPTAWDSDPFGDNKLQSGRRREDNPQDFMILNNPSEPDYSFSFYNVKGDEYEASHELTESNYLQVLESVLS